MAEDLQSSYILDGSATTFTDMRIEALSFCETIKSTDGNVYLLYRIQYSLKPKEANLLRLPGGLSLSEDKWMLDTPKTLVFRFEKKALHFEGRMWTEFVPDQESTPFMTDFEQWLNNKKI